MGMDKRSIARGRGEEEVFTTEDTESTEERGKKEGRKEGRKKEGRRKERRSKPNAEAQSSQRRGTPRPRYKNATWGTQHGLRTS
jgi:hypothetical protein